MGSCCGSPTQEEPLVPEVPAEFKAEMDRDIERCLFRSSMTEDEDDGALDALVRKRVSTWAWRQRLASCPILGACLASLSLHWPQTHPLTTQVDSIKETHKDELGSPKTSDQEGSKREVADITKARLQVHHEKLVIQGKARARSQSVVVRTARRASISMMEQNHIAKGGTKQEFDNQMGQLKRQRTQSLPNLSGIYPSRRFSISPIGRRNSTSQEGPPPSSTSSSLRATFGSPIGRRSSTSREGPPPPEREQQKRKNSIVKFASDYKVAPAPLNDAAATAALVPEHDDSPRSICPMSGPPLL